MANSYTSSTRSIDEFAELIASKTKSEMDEFSSAKRPELISRKDPLAESIKYLSKNDVYELFKVEQRFRIYISTLTLNVNKKPSYNIYF